MDHSERKCMKQLIQQDLCPIMISLFKRVSEGGREPLYGPGACL